MEAKDLMIGDKLKTVFSQKIVEVKEIKQNCIYTEGNGYGYNEIEPIPLTPEILEKNGFTKFTPPPGIHAICYSLDNKKEKYNLTIANYNKYKRLLLNVDSEDSECFNIKCDYVHELQHALRLCGIKKEIVL